MQGEIDKSKLTNYLQVLGVVQ